MPSCRLGKLKRSEITVFNLYRNQMTNIYLFPRTLLIPPLGSLHASTVGSPCIYLHTPIHNPFPMFSYLFPIIFSCFRVAGRWPLLSTIQNCPLRVYFMSPPRFCRLLITFNGFSVHNSYTVLPSPVFVLLSSLYAARFPNVCCSLTTYVHWMELSLCKFVLPIVLPVVSPSMLPVHKLSVLPSVCSHLLQLALLLACFVVHYFYFHHFSLLSIPVSVNLSVPPRIIG